MDGVEERSLAVDVERLAGKRRSEIEAEAIDVHLLDPIAKRVHDHPQRVGVADVQRIAGPGNVDVQTRVVVHQAVIDRVVDATEGEGGPEVVALGGVVVDDVQDHLDAGGVQRLDHLLELGDLLAKRAADGKPRAWRKKPDRVVAPVICQTARDDRHLVEPVVDR